MEDRLYDICIVGAGMIGSSAARHATLLPHTSVCLIGPEEPENLQDNKNGIYGAWFDEARAYSNTAKLPAVAVLSTKSIARYPEIEKLTGIQFYREVGCMTVGIRDADFIKTRGGSAQSVGLAPSELSAFELKSKFPYLHVGDNERWLHEATGAGYLNPRTLVRAQQTAAHLQGCDIINDIASDVTEISQSADSSTKLMQVTTDGGQVVRARKVLLATGASTEFRHLLPDGVRPHVVLDANTVIYAEVSQVQREVMRNMTPLLYKVRCTTRFPAETDAEQPGIFMLPPIVYPDGKYYLKIGSLSTPRTVQSLDSDNAQQVAAWYKGRGCVEEAEWLKQCLRRLLPDFSPRSWHTGTCVTTNTVSRLPYIDLLTPRLGVALGGNGYSAKLCDELGRLAVHLLHQGHWHDKDSARQDFLFVARGQGESQNSTTKAKL